MMIAPRVAHLHLLDVSPEALAVARENLATMKNVSFHANSVSEIPLPPQSLGVLHHIPDTRAAIGAIADKLKPGAPYLIYLYYAFDNRPSWYRMVWAVSNGVRFVVPRLPHPLQRLISEAVAALAYWPLARIAALLARLGVKQQLLPLSWYADKSFYAVRTDAYDRFCTPLEKRFTKAQIESMLTDAGFRDIRFSGMAPY